MLVDSDLNLLIAEDDESYTFFLERAFRDIPLKVPPRTLPDGRKSSSICWALANTPTAANTQSVTFNARPQDAARRWLRCPTLDAEKSSAPCHSTMILSGSSLRTDVDRAFKLGAQAYVTKPTDLNELRKLLANACEFWTWSKKPTA